MRQISDAPKWFIGVEGKETRCSIVNGDRKSGRALDEAVRLQADAVIAHRCWLLKGESPVILAA